MSIRGTPLSHQVPDEDPGRVFLRELRDTAVTTHVGLQGFLLGAECIEQIQGQLPVVPFVVPPQQDMQRNCELAGLIKHRPGHEAPGEKAGGRDARFDQRQDQPVNNLVDRFPGGQCPV